MSDSASLSNVIGNWINQRKVKARQRLLSEGLGHTIQSHYKKDNACVLSALCDKYGSDKGTLKPANQRLEWPAHTYADYYARLFGHCRRHVKQVFECGIGTNNPALASSMGIDGKPGASLRAWRDYFPNAVVHGADIDRNILFKDTRINTHYIDQCDSDAISACFDEIGTSGFDLMIDDGLHTYEAGRTLFESAIKHLAPDGIYIIEDVRQRDLVLFRNYFADKTFVVEYVNLFRPNARLRDNNLVVVRQPACIQQPS